MICTFHKVYSVFFLFLCSISTCPRTYVYRQCRRGMPAWHEVIFGENCSNFADEPKYGCKLSLVFFIGFPKHRALCMIIFAMVNPCSLENGGFFWKQLCN